MSYLKKYIYIGSKRVSILIEVVQTNIINSIPYRPVMSMDFFPIAEFFTNLPLPQNFLEISEVVTKERK